jgi:hypothetical protein
MGSNVDIAIIPYGFIIMSGQVIGLYGPQVESQIGQALNNDEQPTNPCLEKSTSFGCTKKCPLGTHQKTSVCYDAMIRLLGLQMIA